MKFRVSYYCWILIAVILFSCTPSRKYLSERNLQTAGEKRYVRVLIDKTGKEIVISSRGKLKLQYKKSGRILHNKSDSSVKLSAERIQDTVIAESWGQMIAYNGSPYRGMFEISSVLGKVHVVNLIEMEDYIRSVVPSEMPAGWGIEALKAQAVSARSYAYYHLMNNRGRSNLYDLDSTTNFQVYKGVSSETPSTDLAVESTSGEIIIFSGKPVLAYFHSTCGGGTVSGKSVWSGSGYSYLKGVSCGYCSDSPNYSWESVLSIYDVKSALIKKYKNTGSIKNISFKRSEGRISSIEISHGSGKIILSGNEFRLLFPPKTIKSMKFKSAKKGNNLMLTGHGWGHGVGLCQWGARGMAVKGINYKKIISHYFSDIKIEKFSYGDSKYLAERSR